MFQMKKSLVIFYRPLTVSRFDQDLQRHVYHLCTCHIHKWHVLECLMQKENILRIDLIVKKLCFIPEWSQTWMRVCRG